MATKKQKRAENLAKREAFLAEEKALGLDAQNKDRKRELERLEKMRGSDASSVNMDRLKLLRNLKIS